MFHKILKQAKPTTVAPAFIPKLEQIKEDIKEEKNEQPQKPIIIIINEPITLPKSPPKPILYIYLKIFIFG